MPAYRRCSSTFRVEHKNIPDYLGDGWSYRRSGAKQYLVKDGKRMSSGYHYFTLKKTPFGETVYGHNGSGLNPDKITLRRRE
jgi:hypothetical protein